MKANKYVTPKAFWGALIGAGINLGAGFLQQGKQRKLQEQAKAFAKAQAKSTARMQDTARLQDWEYEGAGNIDYYGAMGGKFANPSHFLSKGGMLKQLASDTVVAEGNKHGENTIDNTSGIKLSTPKNPNFLEVEDDEVISDDKVFSDRIYIDSKRTIADVAKELGKTKGKNEEKLKDGDMITKNTGKRNLANIKNNLNSLFFLQEASKEIMGVKDNGSKKPFGGFSMNKGISEIGTGTGRSFNFASSLEKYAPFMDNITNAFITANTPNIPKPTIEPIIPLKTRINVNPQLNDINQSVEKSSEFIKRNTSDSNAARQAITKTRLKGADAKAKIRANKANVEANLYNANVRNAQQITGRNYAKVDRFNMGVMQRQDEIGSRISANISNLSDDIISNRNYKDAIRYNKERLDIAKQMYNQGTTRRALLNNPSEITYLKQNPEYAQEVLKEFKGTKEETLLRELLGLDSVSNTDNYVIPKSFSLSKIGI